MKIKLTQVYISDKDKEGKPLVGKNGPYKKIAVKAQEYGEKWLSGFVGRWNDFWKEGMEVETDIEEVPDGKGGVYLNLKRPDPIAELKVRVEKLEQVVFSLKPEKSIDNPFDQ